MSDATLTIGLPAGSLADPNRGGSLVQLLAHAGFPTRGYDKGGPSSFPITPFLVGWDGRPQEFGSQLALNEIDIAIGGRDWILERQLEFKHEYDQEIALECIHSLGRGGVRLVIIARPDDVTDGVQPYLRDILEQRGLVTMVSEMPYIAYEWFRGQVEAMGLDASYAKVSVQKFKTPPRIDRGIVIYETWGKTEAKVTNGSVDIGLEITQSGSAIRNYGLAIVDEVLESETTIWASPALRSDPEKYDLARMFLMNLYGSIYAEDRVLVLFNARREEADAIRAYLSSNRLFGDEPTINEGPHYLEFSVSLNATSRELPLARARYELAKLGATAIETIPLESSIPGLDVIKF